MINAQRREGAAYMQVPIQTYIAHHGAWRVLGAAVVALVRNRGRARPLPPRHLSNRLRQDIGLPPIDDLGLPPYGPIWFNPHQY